MDVNVNDLVVKIINFWDKYPHNEWDVSKIRNEFSKDELVAIMNSANYDAVIEKNAFVIQSFYSKIYEINNLFTVDEIYEFNPDIKTDDLVSLFFFTLSDDKLVELLKRYNSPDIQYEIFSTIRTDYYRDIAMNYMKKSRRLDEIVSQFESDELMLKHLKSVPYSLRGYVVANLKDDYYKEKFLTLFSGNKSSIICSLSTDEKKIHYFKKYYLLLDSYEKIDIISSFTNVDNIMKYAHIFKKEDDYQYFIGRFVSRDRIEVAVELCERLKDEETLATVLRRYLDEFPIERVLQMFEKLNDGYQKTRILTAFPDDLKIKYIETIGQANRKVLIESIVDLDVKISSLQYLEKFSDIEGVIEHTEKFPVYTNEYQFLLDKYATCYNLNKDNLLYIVKNIDMSVLKLIKNENLRKIINSDEQAFYKIMELFGKQNYTLDASSMNDVLNSLLQREFKLARNDIVLIFPMILQAFDFGNNEKAISLIEKMISDFKSEFDIEEYLESIGYTKDSFIDSLIKKDTKAVEVLHDVTARYIRFKRNEYIKDNLVASKDKTMKSKFDKKSMMKCILNKFPVDLIMVFFPLYSEYKENGWYESRGFTDEELELLKNRDLIVEIIKYKKNPSSYSEIPLEVKQNLWVFNKLFEVVLNNNYLVNSLDIGANKIYSFKEVSGEHIVSILASLDVEKLQKGILSNPEMFEKIFKLLKQYKMLGWGNSYDSLLSGAGIVIDEETIANFIQYFPVIYTELSQKIEKGQLNTMSLTAMLDLAMCFSTESYKYSYLFGAEDFKLIASNPGPNSSSMVKEKRISNAIEDLKVIRNRDYVSVPPIDKDFDLKSGKKMNVVVGNFSNPINLTYGERTGACMRIGGAGESLYNFCLESDHGFHIRFVNPVTGGFVSRVSGFRNGNTVFLNQLRYSVDSSFSNLDVMEACKLVAKEIVELSRGSNSPIDNVVISSDMVMSGQLVQSFGVRDIKKGLSTKDVYSDVGEYGVVLATSRLDNSLVPVKLGNIGVKKYLVQRDKVRILYDKNCLDYIRHIEVMDQVLGGTSIDNVTISDEVEYLICYTGEDWYVALDKTGKISQYIMKNSNNKEKALEEVQQALEAIKMHLEDTINITQNTGLGM